MTAAKTKKPAPKRTPSARLKSMRVSPGFREYVFDQLAGVPGLRQKPMFGAIGLYSNSTFFGIVAADVLYLKVDEATRPVFEHAGGEAFAPFKDRPSSVNYFSVPAAILEDRSTLGKWAARAVAARASRKPKRPRRLD